MNNEVNQNTDFDTENKSEITEPDKNNGSNKLPIFKNKWFWIVIAGIVLIVIVIIAVASSNSGNLCSHEYSNASCVAPSRCVKCGVTNGSPLGHSFSEATCLLPKKCDYCGETEGEALGHDFKPATYYSPSTCSRCYETTGEKLRSISEWGFYDIDEFSVGDTCVLVNISGYNLNEGYVVCDENLYCITLKDGWFRIVYEGEYEGYYDGISNYSYDGKFTVSSGPYQYTTYDNNTIRWSGGEWNGEYGEHTLMITDREVYNDNIILKCDNFGFVPYTMIDESKPYVQMTSEEEEEKWGSGKIKVYLKGY